MAHSIDRLSKGQLVFIVALAFLSVAPLVFPFIPPLTDLPTHVSRFAIVANRHDAFLSQFYAIIPALTGNLGIDLPVLLLLPWLGPETATKAVILLIPALSMIGTCRLSLALHREVTPFAILAGAMCYSVPFHMGFANYCLGLALMWNATATWISRPNESRGLFIASALGILIWFAHAVAWGLFVAILFGLEIGKAQPMRRQFLRAVVTALAALVPAATVQIVAATSTVGLGVGSWFKLVGKVSALVRVLQYDQRTAGILLLIALLASVGYFAWRENVRLNRKMSFAAAAVTVVFILMPEVAFHSAYADTRIAVVVWICALLSLSPTSMPRRDVIIATVLVSAFFAYWTARYADISNHQQDLLKVADRIPLHSRIAFLNVQSCDLSFSPDPGEHIFSLLIGRKRSFAPYWTTIDGYVSVRYPAAGRYQNVLLTAAPLGACKAAPDSSAENYVANLPRAAFDFLLIQGAERSRLHLDGGFRLISHGTAADLYRIDHSQILPSLDSSHKG